MAGSEDWWFTNRIEELERHIAELEAQLKFNSARYSEGFGWDIDDADGVYREPQQIRRWNPNLPGPNKFEPGRDPSPFPLPPTSKTHE